MNIDYIICFLLIIIIILLLLDKTNKNKEPFLDKTFMSVDENKGALNLEIIINNTSLFNLYYYINKNTNKLTKTTSSDFKMYINAVKSDDLQVPRYTETSDYPDKVEFEEIDLNKTITLNGYLSQEIITNALNKEIYNELSQDILKYDTDGEIPIINLSLTIQTNKPFSINSLMNYINNAMESLQF